MARSLGIHVSIAERLDLAVDRALELGCLGTFQIFTCSPRRWAAKALDETQVGLFKGKSSASKYVPAAHMPYMPNLASPDSKFYSESVQVLVRELKRSDQLDVPFLVVHFGSHKGSSLEDGHNRIVSACNEALAATEGTHVRILLENSAGVRNSLGSGFSHIAKVLARIENKDRMGVCLDTCHAFASGYDLRTGAGSMKMLKEFDETIGLHRLFLIHVNDSKGGLGQGNDRHEHIGLGRIGDKGFREFFARKEIENLPLVLETPIDSRRGDKENVLHLKKLVKAE